MLLRAIIDEILPFSWVSQLTSAGRQIATNIINNPELPSRSLDQDTVAQARADQYNAPLVGSLTGLG